MPKTIRIAVDESLLEQIDSASAMLGLSRSAFIRKVLRQTVEQNKVAQLERRHAMGYARRPVEPGEFDVMTMDQSKQRRLEEKGWKVGSVEEFLELTPEEASYIEVKLALSGSLRSYRKQRQLTQADLARLLKSSQSRVARMEAGDPSVSLDLLVRSLLAMGATRETLAQIIASPLAASS